MTYAYYWKLGPSCPSMGRSPCGLHLELSPQSFTLSSTHSLAPFTSCTAPFTHRPKHASFFPRPKHLLCEKSDFQSIRLHLRVKGAQAKGVAPNGSLSAGILAKSRTSDNLPRFCTFALGCSSLLRPTPGDCKITILFAACFCYYLYILCTLLFILLYIIIIYFLKHI